MHVMCGRHFEVGHWKVELASAQLDFTFKVLDLQEGRECLRRQPREVFEEGALREHAREDGDTQLVEVDIQPVQVAGGEGEQVAVGHLQHA